MCRIVAIALSCWLGLLAATPYGRAGTAAFLTGTDDVPLMPGLSDEASQLVVFDKPEGRIVEAEARGRVSRAAAERFYATSLPGLGWIADGPHAWRRDNEALRLDFAGRDGALRIGFSLAPR